MKEKKKRKIILEDGREFYGEAFGACEDRVCEIVFNTSMAGYQEILSDLSYTDQAVVMTYPLIGNYGMAAEDYESINPSIGAMIVREYQEEPSNFRSVGSLGEVMALITALYPRLRDQEGPAHGCRNASGKGAGDSDRRKTSHQCCLPRQLQGSLDSRIAPACIECL